MQVKLKITQNKISRQHICRYYSIAGIAAILLMITTLVFVHNAEYNIYLAGFFGWEFLKEWFMSLGKKYNVNPYIFGGIYVGAIPFFTISLGWLIKRKKNKESIILPALSTGFFFISTYLYLIIVGQNVPLWVYGIIIIILLFGIFSTIKKIKNRVGAE